MFTNGSAGGIEVAEEAAFVRALASKLEDIDKTRIHASDDLVIRKAVFGLIEIVAVLEQRIVALENPAVSSTWADRLRAEQDSWTPDQIRLGE